MESLDVAGRTPDTAGDPDHLSLPQDMVSPIPLPFGSRGCGSLWGFLFQESMGGAWDNLPGGG